MNSSRIRILSRAVVVLAAALFLAAPAPAGEVLDQENATGTAGFNPALEWSQSFKPAYNNVTAAAINIYGIDGATAILTITLLDGPCGNIIASGTTETAVEGWTRVDFSGGPIPVVPEQEYWLEITPFNGAWSGNSVSSYPRGELYLANLDIYVCDPYGTRDMFFRTYSEDSFQPVPVRAVTWGSLKSLHQ